MTIIMISYFKNKSEVIPAIIIGILLDSITIYGMYDFINYILNYY